MARFSRCVPLAVAVAALAGCGGSKNAGSPTTAPTATAAPPVTTAATAPPTATAAAPSPLTPEAQSAATGDIPDNQVFLIFRSAGYSIRYPEGWAEQGSGTHVTFRDKNNIVRIVVEPGAVPTPASVKADIKATIASGPQRLTLSGHPALKVTYTSESAANAVTGKKVTLVVDRYYLWRGGKRAVVDLGTPQGVDNVDAYRLMIQSFRWR